MTKALKFNVKKVCCRTRARAGLLQLCQPNEKDYVKLHTPVFMPVGTNGTMKGLLPEQVESTGCRLMLSNTYHLASRPGTSIVEKAGGLHQYMRWPHALLTDSGGFQMVSLSKLMTVSEEHVTFTNPYEPNKVIDLSPEDCIRVQQQIGANIVMQLDDVLPSTAVDYDRFVKATDRTVRWLDRALQVHQNRKHVQSLFPIIQGGLNLDLRRKCTEEMLKREFLGIAIGGLSGGEAKAEFVKVVHYCTGLLPEPFPRYCMGVGFSIDMLICIALGVDMFDCVYPTRTARFGSALIRSGQKLNLKNGDNANDFDVIEKSCDCATCLSGTSRAYIHQLMKSGNEVGCHLISTHNIRFQLRFMGRIREAIGRDEFIPFCENVLADFYGNKQNYPDWVVSAFNLLGIDIQ